MYTGGFGPFSSPEEYWAWWSRHILVNRYAKTPFPVYDDLLRLLRGKDYFIITTNVDQRFRLAGFPEDRIFCVQGDYGRFQCPLPCSQETYENESVVREMVRQQKNMRIPTALVPRCPRCGRPMIVNLRCDDSFVQDQSWYEGRKRYVSFLSNHATGHVLFLELGVGENTPIIIRYPFWRLTEANKKATYAAVNIAGGIAPDALLGRSLLIRSDIGTVLKACLQITGSLR